SGARPVGGRGVLAGAAIEPECRGFRCSRRFARSTGGSAVTPSITFPHDFSDDLRRWQMRALVSGGVLMILSSIGAVFNPGQFFRSYLMGYLFWIGLALGSMGLVMVQYLTGGAWGLISRRTLESAMLTLPALAVLFLPIIFGIPSLYEWSHAD